MTKTELITPNYLKPGHWGTPTPKLKKAIREFTIRQNSGNYAVNKSVENLVTKLNSMTSYDEVPDKIMFSYTDLVKRNLDFKETYDLVNLTLKLAAARLGHKPKHVIFTGFAGAADQSSSLSNTDYKNLVSAGFTGCTLSPMMYGLEAAEESVYCINKDPYYWSPVAVPDTKVTPVKSSTQLEITLTFRQEQIFKMVCTGMTNRQIAMRLNLSESTVKMHIGILLKKYRAQHRSRLIVLDKRPIL